MSQHNPNESNNTTTTTTTTTAGNVNNNSNNKDGIEMKNQKSDNNIHPTNSSTSSASQTSISYTTYVTKLNDEPDSDNNNNNNNNSTSSNIDLNAVYSSSSPSTLSNYLISSSTLPNQMISRRKLDPQKRKSLNFTAANNNSNNNHNRLSVNVSTSTSTGNGGNAGGSSNTGSNSSGSSGGQNILSQKLEKIEFESQLKNTVVTVLDLSCQNTAYEKEKCYENDLIKIYYKFNKVKELNLSGLEVREFPEQFQNLAHLEVLNLSKSELRQLPRNFEVLSNSLVHLNVRLNCLKYWPWEVNRFTKLKVLDLAFNDISQMNHLSAPGKSIVGAAMKRLKGIAGKEKDTSHTVSYPIFQNLEVLDLSFNQLTSFPHRILDFVNLTHLNLTKNKIVEIPPSIVKLQTSLTNLKCDSISLNSFPESVCDLMALKVLSLNDNRIPNLPTAQGKMYQLVSLQELYMNNCGLKGWSQLYCQAKLRVLHLSGNQLMGIPTEITTLIFLEDLRLSKNSISHIPTHLNVLTSLKYLDISENHIEDIDTNCFNNLKSLNILKLDHNRIQGPLPCSFDDLISLEELYIHNNSITGCPSFKKLEKLVVADLSYNLLTELPKDLQYCGSLEKLDITMNRVSKLPPEFYELKKLRYARLKHNAIESIDKDLCAKLQSLEELNLDNNELETIPSSILSLSLLQKLYVSYNWPGILSNDMKKYLEEQCIAYEDNYEYADKILDGVYIGSANAATSKKMLKSLGITHILTVAKEIPPRYINNFHYMVIYVEDAISATLKPHFHQAKIFIDHARRHGGGVIIHCMAGVSRSATISTSYLMLTNNWSLRDAYRHLKQSRKQVKPNQTFKTELGLLEKELQEQDPNYGTSNSIKELSPSTHCTNLVEEISKMVNSNVSPSGEKSNRLEIYFPDGRIFTLESKKSYLVNSLQTDLTCLSQNPNANLISQPKVRNDPSDTTTANTNTGTGDSSPMIMNNNNGNNDVAAGGGGGSNNNNNNTPIGNNSNAKNKCTTSSTTSSTTTTTTSNGNDSNPPKKRKGGLLSFSSAPDEIEAQDEVNQLEVMMTQPTNPPYSPTISKPPKRRVNNLFTSESQGSNQTKEDIMSIVLEQEKLLLRQEMERERDQ